MIHFSNPSALFLLLVAPFFLLFAWMWQHRIARRMSHFSRHAPRWPKYARVQLVLIALGLLFACFALSRPHWGKVDNPKQSYTIRNRNLMIAVDISRSMLAQDIQPNRLEYVKADILEFLETLKNDRVGLIVFKGEAEVVCPLTADITYVKEQVAQLTPTYLPPGETNLAKPIRLAMEAFEIAQTKQHLLLLISDGESLTGGALEAASAAAEREMPIFTVGVGNPSGTVLTIDGETVRWQGEAVRTALDEQTLKAIAERSKGRYLPLATSRVSKSSLASLYEHYLSQIASDEVQTMADLVYKDRTWIFLVVSVLCFLAAACFSSGRISLGRRKAPLAVVALWVAVSGFAATPGREAQAAYQAGDYSRAVSQYTLALQTEGLETDEIASFTYNKALAQWKMGDPAAALRTLEGIAQVSDYQTRVAALRAQLMYEGMLAQCAAITDENPMPPQQRLQLQLEVIEAYTQALRLDPENASAKRNLACVMADYGTLRTNVRKDEVSKRFEKDEIPAMLQRLLKTQRELIENPPKQSAEMTPAEVMASAKQFADTVSEQADAWFYLATCAEEKWDKCFTPPPEQQLSPKEVQRLQDMRNTIHTKMVEAYASLDALVARYRALEASPEPLLPLEETTYQLWKTFADLLGQIDEAIAMRQCLIEGKMPRYHQSRPIRQEARSFERMISIAVDQLLQQPPQHLDEEKQKTLATLNEALKSALQQPESPEQDQAMVERLQQIRALLLPPSQNQQQQQQQDQQNQQQNQNQQQQQSSSQEQQQQQQQQAQEQQSSEAQQQQQAENNQQQQTESLSEEEKQAAMERAKAEEEALKEALKHQELNAILKEAEERSEALEREKRAYKVRQSSKRNVKDW
jgi:Ca-activated chloride channel family protein